MFLWLGQKAWEEGWKMGLENYEDFHDYLNSTG